MVCVTERRRFSVGISAAGSSTMSSLRCVWILSVLTLLSAVHPMRRFSVVGHHVPIHTSTERVNELDENEASRARLRRLARHFEVVDIPETVEHYRRVHKRSIAPKGEFDDGGNDGGLAAVTVHPRTADFAFDAFGRHFQLRLRLNDELLPRGHHMRVFDGNNSEQVEDHSVVHCHYQGYLHGPGLGEQKTFAAVSTCYGVSGVFGIGEPGRWEEGPTYFIEPMSEQPRANGSHAHAVFRANDLYNLPGSGRTCGLQSTHDAPRGQARHMKGSGSSSLPLHRQYLSTRTHLDRYRRSSSTNEDEVSNSTSGFETYMYVETVLVMDSTLYGALGWNRSKAHHRASCIANFVDMIYKPLLIRVPLVAVELWSKRHAIYGSGNAGQILETFIDHRSNMLLKKVHHDSAQLLTSVPFYDGTIGLAPLASMCSRRSAGLSADRVENPSAVTASTVAHEMGHTLGMNHDTSRCVCEGTKGKRKCVMESSAGSVTPTKWSSCSINYLKKFLLMGGGHCLHNRPSRFFHEALCGDGFVEGEEECDCGSVIKCQNTCCDASTCRLTENAVCSGGGCCSSSCQLHHAGKVCRAALNDCDTPEVCNGSSSSCPTDTFAQDGQVCQPAGTSISSWCYQGMCKNFDSQCKDLWGGDAHAAPRECFTANMWGTDAANCGTDSERRPVQCASGDAGCGRLWCLGGPATVDSSQTYHNRAGGVQCKATASYDTRSDVIGLGYVQDGVRCGNESICIGRKCRRISSLGLQPCPASNGRICGGNGICNNMNRCQCGAGWTGSSCTTPFYPPVDGMWNAWSAWSSCSGACDEIGRRARQRFCDNPSPSRGGRQCTGADLEEVECGKIFCPTVVNGSWTSWTHWSACSSGCWQAGAQVRMRTCSDPLPGNGGQHCKGATVAARKCSKTAGCLGSPNGHLNTPSCSSCWLPWQTWSPCSATCGGGFGVSVRVRSCDSLSCTGPFFQERSCGHATCNLSLSNGMTEWTSWRAHGNCSQCSANSDMVRYRYCVQPVWMNATQPSCSGQVTERKLCAECLKESKSSGNNRTVGAVLGVLFGVFITASVVVLVCIVLKQRRAKMHHVRVNAAHPASPDDAGCTSESHPPEPASRPHRDPAITRQQPSIGSSTLPDLVTSQSTDNLLSGTSSNEHSPVPARVASRAQHTASQPSSSSHAKRSPRKRHAHRRRSTPAVIASIQLRDALAPLSNFGSEKSQSELPRRPQGRNQASRSVANGSKTNGKARSFELHAMNQSSEPPSVAPRDEQPTHS